MNPDSSTPPPLENFKKERPELPSVETTEADLSRLTSISRDDLRKLREKLSQGGDWTGGDGKPIVLTTAGLERLRVLLAEKAAQEAAEALQSAGAAVQDGSAYVALVVVRVATPRVLLAKKAAGDVEGPSPLLVRVMVKNARHFAPGMELARCQASGRFPDLYFYHGGLPRRRGINPQVLKARQQAARARLALPQQPVALQD